MKKIFATSHCIVCSMTGTLLLLALSPMTYSDENQLKIKPARCIALHEGQQCYQKLTISWQSDISSDYCLYHINKTEPVECWEHQTSGITTFEFKSDASKQFILQRKLDAKVVAEFTVEVAWVYNAKSHPESHWRIF